MGSCESICMSSESVVSEFEDLENYEEQAKSIVEVIENEIQVFGREEKLCKLRIWFFLEKSEMAVRENNDEKALKLILRGLEIEKTLKQMLVFIKMREFLKEEFEEAESVFDQSDRTVKMSQFCENYEKVKEGDLFIKEKLFRGKNSKLDSFSFQEYYEETEEQEQLQRIKRIVDEKNYINQHEVDGREGDETSDDLKKENILISKIFNKRIEEIYDESEEIGDKLLRRRRNKNN